MDRTRNFAIQIVRKLRGALPVSEKGARGFCMALVAALEDIESWLREASNSDILNVLDQLEFLVQSLLRWPRSYQVSLPAENQPVLARDRTNFPGLCCLRDGRQWGRENIRAYATDRRETKRRSALLAYLATLKCSAPAGYGLDAAEFTSPTMQQDPKHGSGEHMRILYTELSKIGFCKDLQKYIPVNLRLRDCGGQGGSRHIHLFRIFFLNHPHEDPTGSIESCRWQDSSICVFRRRVATEPRGAAERDETTGFMTAADFCKLVSQNSLMQLRLNFFYHGVCVSNDASKMHHPSQRPWRSPTSVSLLEILNSATQPSKKTRLLLCYQLAKAFWRFYGSDWMANPWTKENVRFMFDNLNKPRGILLSDPYLAVSDPPTPCERGGAPEGAVGLAAIRSHQFPKILALGIMLTEIELGLKIEDEFGPECFDTDRGISLNATHTTGQHIYLDKRELWEHKETFPQLQKAIATCLAVFRTDEHLSKKVPMPLHDPFLNYKDDNKGDLPKLCDAINKHIVRPLESLCVQTWWGDESDPEKWEVPLFKTGEHAIGPAALAASPLVVRSQADATALSSHEWFHQLADMNSVIRMKDSERDIKSPRVKIAILDTGIHQPFSSQVKGYRDFIKKGDATAYMDGTGHGTQIFQLLQRVCDVADFYIGRVWEGSRATGETPRLMKEAIDWARDPWGVDIIVLPSGFQTAHDDIEAAIEDANRARILTFASPSNYGNCTDIYFPGRLYSHGKVLCLFSTNAMVKNSSAFNPSPIETAKHRTFAILGEDIILENQQSPLSGTSFSTAIGAGVAARILDFSRHRNYRHQIGKVEDLTKVEGMLAVFGRMAQRTDNDYRCMAPWRICNPTSMEGEERANALKRQRSEVCDALRVALGNIQNA